jgi:NTE family protein
MSVPLLFEPCRIENIPQGKEAWELWDKIANFHADLPSECILVDGGIMSNFPIDVFHKRMRVPVAPTFGAKLGTQQRATRSIRNATALCGAVFNAARHCLDFDFVTRNPDYSHVVQCIDTGDHDWLNFGLSDEQKFDLFACGAKAAEQFLRRFRWERYKAIRKELAEAFAEDQHYARTAAEARA